jgi:DNA-binding GntR family transcriptional regulator
MKNAIHEEVLREIFPRKYRKRQISQEIYEQLKKMIHSGKLEKGQRLVEERLANQLNVSRNPIRIAILQLREEGLVAWKFKKGTYVS